MIEELKEEIRELTRLLSRHERKLAYRTRAILEATFALDRHDEESLRGLIRELEQQTALYALAEI